MVWRAALSRSWRAACSRSTTARRSTSVRTRSSTSDFNWQVLETEHFLIHYYPEEARAAMRRGAHGGALLRAPLARSRTTSSARRSRSCSSRRARDFGQNNVTGDLGEGTGGVTERCATACCCRSPATIRSFEHVLTHEMVHEFQYDIFARGRAGGGHADARRRSIPPLWFMEGMAEYLSLGPSYTRSTDGVDARRGAQRQAADDRADDRAARTRYFPYRYGQSLWAYIGQRWGDESDRRRSWTTCRAWASSARSSASWACRSRISATSGARRCRRKYLPAGRVARAPAQVRAAAAHARRAPAARSSSRRRSRPTASTSRSCRTAASLKRRGVHRPLARRRRDRQAHQAAGEEHDRSELRGAAAAVFAERLLSRRQDARVHGAARRAATCCICSTSKRESARAVRSAARRHRRARAGRRTASRSFSAETRAASPISTSSMRTGRISRSSPTTSTADMQPQWSPDGKTIAFATDRGSRRGSRRTCGSRTWRIAHLSTSNGGNVELIPGQDGLNINPKWAPDWQVDRVRLRSHGRPEHSSSTISRRSSTTSSRTSSAA